LLRWLASLPAGGFSVAMRSGDPEISGCRFETLEAQREPFLIWAILGAIWQMYSGAMEPLCESMRSTAILH